jgi:hypothetical protein
MVPLRKPRVRFRKYASGRAAATAVRRKTLFGGRF